MIKIYFRSIKERRLKASDKFRKGSWVVAEAPDEEEREKLAKLLSIDADLLRDAMDEFEVPRLEVEKKVAYVFTRVPHRRGNETVTVPVMIAIGEDFVFTVAREKIDLFDAVFDGKKDVYTTQKTKFFLEFLFAINKRYGYFLLELDKNVRALRVKLERINVRDIVKFVDLEKILNDFLSALVPTNAALENILKGRQVHFYEEDRELIEDLSVAYEQQVELAKSILRHAVNIRNAYSNIMDHDLNRVMKILTALTILLTVPTMIFSFYGMNIRLPLMDSSAAIAYIISGTVVISGILLSIFMRNRWL